MSKPIELDQFITAIKDISQENIQSVKSQLLLSIEKLLHTNDLLKEEVDKVKLELQKLKPEESHDSLKEDYLLYTESIDENKKVIQDQKLRIYALLDELHERGLVGEILVTTEKDRVSELIGEVPRSKQEETTQAEDGSIYL